MNILSEEQSNILNKVNKGNNIMVDAVAGTGKTTLILSVAKENPDKKILQMTYNSSLRMDVKSKVTELELKNIKIHTFHSLAVRYYDPNSFTDSEIRRILIKNKSPISDIMKFDIIVLDECQDMTFLYFQFMVKFIKDMGSPIQLLILGDYMQGIYDFKGADIRFLTMADSIWYGFPLLRTNIFEKCTMKMSFRITNQICSFVNNVMLGENRMNACRNDQEVVYIRNSRDNIQKIISAEIYKLFEKGVKPEEIFILAPSVKGINSNIRKLENRLVEKNIPCHVPMLESEKIDDRVIGGKIVFSTFHCVKGRQRKYVFVLGFDNSYHRFFARNKPEDECPNALYVAVTRAINVLYLLENNQYREDRPLKFLKKSHIEMKQCDYIDFRGLHQTNFIDDISSDIKNNFKHYITPTELIKFIPESILDQISPIIDRIFIKDEIKDILDEIEIPNIIETKMGFFEEISDLNGIAIPSMYYDILIDKYSDKNNKSNCLLQFINKSLEKMKQNDHIYLKDIIEKIPENIVSIEDYLYIANICIALQEKLYFKLKQIDKEDYNWLDNSILDKCKIRLDSIIGSDCNTTIPIIEETIINENDDLYIYIDDFLKQHFGDNKLFRFNARVDLITDNIIWEIKCTSKLTIEHKIQLIIYAWLWQMRSINDNDTEKDKQVSTKNFKLFNFKTGEILSLSASIDDLNNIIVLLLKGKYQDELIKSDEEFVKECNEYLEISLNM